jgi:four helix bundle protein
METTMDPRPSRGFAHQRLDAYQVALDLARGVVALTTGLGSGNAELKDQLLRSTFATLRHIAEGASRMTSKDRRQRFVVARGECAECDAVLESALLLGVTDPNTIRALRKLADRVGAMLTGLMFSTNRRIVRPPNP